jgi:hypothetical protein
MKLAQIRTFIPFLMAFILCLAVTAPPTAADAISTPNITMNVDTNRAASTGAGAGDASVAVNTITLAELGVAEYVVGGDSRIIFGVRPGYQFDPSSEIRVQSATLGFNGGPVNGAVTFTPIGAADETFTVNLTSAVDNSASVQDIVRITGIRLRILNAIGAAGPAQTTMFLTTSTAGGTFSGINVVSATITRGASHRLVFATQPGDTEAGEELLPAVQMVDFGGNVVIDDPRTITLSLEQNPGGATLDGNAERTTVQGTAAWQETDDLTINTAGSGYTLRASHSGASFLSSDTVESAPFDVIAGPAGSIEITTHPQDTVAGTPILISVTARDAFGNPSPAPVEVTLDAAVNPQGWPLLVDTTLTKMTVNGVATWDATDNLRVTRAVAGYRLTASGLGPPQFSAPFDILAGEAAALRFVQPPSDVEKGEAVSPPVSVEIIDAFGNRTGPTASVELTLDGDACGGAATGSVAAAVAGLAEFPALRFDKACDDVTLRATSAGLIGTTSDAFDIEAGPAAALQFSVQPADTTAGEPLLVSVQVLDSVGQPFTAPVGVTLALGANPSGAALLVDTSLTKQTVDGVAAWVAADKLRIETAAENYTLTAAGAGVTVTSAAYEIRGAAPAAVQFVQQPGDVTEGEAMSPAVTVEVRDAFGNPAANGTAVTLELVDSCGAQLAGGAGATAGGVASFASLAIDKACENVALRAVVEGVSPVTSNSFDVLRSAGGPPACGACGAGAPLAFAPLLLLMMPRGRRWLRGER